MTSSILAPAPGATLRRAIFPRASVLTDIALVAAGAVFIALFAQISIPLPFTPVPITGQTFAVLLVGGALGGICGSASVALYLVLGIAGAPVYADHHHGWSVVAGATGGYLVGFLVAGTLVGYLADRGWDRRFATSGTMMLVGNTFIFVIGCIWLRHVLHTNLAKTLEYGLYPFVPGEILKLYLAAALLPGAWALVRRIRG